jgi:thiol-disulfide isomerase/thioredoxin
MNCRKGNGNAAWMMLTLSVVLTACGHGENRPSLSEVEGVPLLSVVPEFSLPMFDAASSLYAGEAVALYGDWLAAEKPVVVNFWATWCGPCIVELPFFEELAERRPDLTVTTVAVADTTDYLPRFIDRSGLSLPVMVDPDGKVSAKLDSNILPATLVFGVDGTLLLRFVGSFYSADHLEENVDKALARWVEPPDQGSGQSSP